MQLIHGDCLEKMKDIPDKSIDMILCDLPYGTTACKWDVVIPLNKYVQIGKKVIYEQEYVFDKMKSGVSYKEALENFLSVSKDGLWDNYKRIIKDRGAIVLFGSEPFSSYLRMSNIKQFRYDIIWNKRKPSNFQMMNFQPGRIHEVIHIFSNSPAVYCNNKHMIYYPIKTMLDKPYYDGQIRGTKNSTLREGHSIKDLGKRLYVDKHPTSIIDFTNANIKIKVHPTEKPVALLEYLIKTYTLEGETVLDNTMGSGSTGVACVNTKRNFIGIEKDDRYFEIAKKRIEEAQNANT